MNYSRNIAKFFFHLEEAIDAIREASPSEKREIVRSGGTTKLLQAFETDVPDSASGPDFPRTRWLRHDHDFPFRDFRFDNIMNNLRSAIISAGSNERYASDLDWILRILLESPKLFETVRETDNFLSNMTGALHKTKSTGRDRIVDWYFKYIESLPREIQDQIFHRMARYIFISARSNYREWRQLLSRTSKN